MKAESGGSLFERFLHSQASGSIVLMLAAVTAVIWANTPWAKLYHDLSHLDIGVTFAGKTYQMGLAHWVKDGLMTLFFFVVGLEIKREVLIGELSSLRKAALPVMAAIGGCVVPALIYFYFNRTGQAAGGWGVPMATDIAFALGILALLGDRVPIGLKVFLTALAIVDDLIAVLVIAIFYTAQININALVTAAGFLGLFFLAVRFQARRPILYLFPAIGVWASIMVSGIHATVAGVLIAMLVPVKSNIEPEQFFNNIWHHIKYLHETGPLTRESLASNPRQWKAMEQIYLTTEDMIPPGIYLEKHFHTPQAFIILPLFALFSAGVTFNAEIMSAFPDSVSIGIICGLVLGKPVGILMFSCLTIMAGGADMPSGVKWPHLLGAGILGGIGFTMSIFISELAFSDSTMIDEAKIGIFIASFLAGITGYILLNMTLARKEA
jgi:NhaA family Na+:H+ antiporter